MDPLKFKTTIHHLPKLKLHYLRVPEEVVTTAGGIGSRFLCSVNGKPSFHAGLVALGGGEAYITLKKDRMNEAGLQLGDQVTVELTPDKSKYGMEMPEELEALLDQDEEGARRFEQLSPGKKRYIIYYVSQVKSSQLKIDRAIKLINNLKKLPEGEFDFRYLLGLPPRES